MAELPEVVSMTRKNGRPVNNYDVYIGCAVTRGGWDLADSKWRNPFTLEYCEGGREKTLARYRRYITETPDLMASLAELGGKRLGCLCVSEHCHGHVLVDLYRQHVLQDAKSALSS
jgi:hypothetical protein